MAEAIPFVLDDFVASTRQTSVPVQVPHGGRFRIHPDKRRPNGPFLLARCDDEWWLVHPHVAEQVRIPHLWRAELYEGVYEDGRVFVAPVTHPLPGRMAWYDSLSRAIRLARSQWVAIASDPEQGCYEVRTHDKLRAEPDWEDYSFADLVELAFEGRIVTSVAQATKKWPQRTRRAVPDEFEE